jgi:hypothetical protein
MGEWGRLRRRCEAALLELPVPDPFDLEGFCAAIAGRRGRPIVLRPVAGVGQGVTGVWLAVDDPPLDVIVYEARTSPLHRQHIVLHELGHVLAGHSPRVGGPGSHRLLFPDLDPEAVRRTLEREAYSSEEEREAELLASLILHRATRRGPDDPGSDAGRRLEALINGDGR